MKSKLILLFLLGTHLVWGNVPLPKPKNSPSPFDKVEKKSEAPPYNASEKHSSDVKPSQPDSNSDKKKTEDKKTPEKGDDSKQKQKSATPKFYNPFLKKNQIDTSTKKDESEPKTKTLVPSYRSKKSDVKAPQPSTPPPFIKPKSSTPEKAKESSDQPSLPANPYTIEKAPEAKPKENTTEKTPKEHTSPKDSSYEPPKFSTGDTSSSTHANVEKKKIPATGEEGYTINFNKISITEFLRFVGEIAKVNFVFHEDDLIGNSGSPFTITLVSEEPTRVSDIMTMLLQTLQSHGLALMDRGDNIVIYKSSKPTQLARVVTGKFGDEHDSQIPIITRVFSLSASSANDISRIIRSLLSKNALLEVSVPTNQIIITDLSQNIKRVEELIVALDKPFGGLEIGKYVVETAVASELVTTAQQILLPLSDGKPLILVPHNTSDSIFIVADPSLISKSIKVLAALDVGTPISDAFYDESSIEEKGARTSTQTKIQSKTQTSQEAQTSKPTQNRHIDNASFKVYKLRHHKGNSIASSLNEIGESLKGLSGENNDLINAISTMRWIPSSNSLIITGTEEAVSKVKRLVSSLDSPLRQVFIEMLILETTVQSSFGFGVQWGLTGSNSSRRYVGAATADTISSGGNGILDMIQNKSPSLPAGLGLGVIGDLLVHNGQPLASFGALINAIQADTETSILMNPRLITQDAKSAEIFVGVNVPYKSATIQPNIGEATTEFEYRNVGTRLVVTPYLGNSDLVTLEISQDISEIADQESNDQTLLNQNTPKSSTTSTNTTVHVPDNHFLMISGMIRSASVRGHTGIPCLGSVPVVGDVSGSKSYTKQKSNIIIFIRPHIISTEQELASLTKHQNERFEKAKKLESFEEEKREIFDIMDIYND